MSVRRTTKYYLLSFVKHDLKASITVFFVALPLCLGISLASNVPVYSGLVAGIVGGIIVTVLSGSPLSVSGPAAGLTAICVSTIAELGSLEAFFLVVIVAGIFQFLLGAFKLVGFTHLIPSTVIKGMLAAIGILLISKQFPLLLGYDKADFWTKELFNILTFHDSSRHIRNIYENVSAGVILVSILSFLLLLVWKKWLAAKFSFIPASIVVVFSGVLLARAFANIPLLALDPAQFVNVPHHVFSSVTFPDYGAIFSDFRIIKAGLIVCFVASLETLLSLEAIDKLDAMNRQSPQNRELMAQGVGNIVSGTLGGLPLTAVILRSSANAEAGARTKFSAFFHGVWMLLLILLGVSLINSIPYCVLAVILVRTGFNLAKPKMISAVYRLGREQFLPFAVTVVAILFTDLLIGVCIGIVYAAYFILKNTYKAGYTVESKTEGHTRHYYILLANNVSFMNKKKIREELENIPEYSIVEIDGSHSVYIDYDVLEVINEYKSMARHRHIELKLIEIPEVETISMH